MHFDKNSYIFVRKYQRNVSTYVPTTVISLVLLANMRARHKIKINVCLLWKKKYHIDDQHALLVALDFLH